MVCVAALVIGAGSPVTECCPPCARGHSAVAPAVVQVHSGDTLWSIATALALTVTPGRGLGPAGTQPSRPHGPPRQRLQCPANGRLNAQGHFRQAPDARLWSGRPADGLPHPGRPILHLTSGLLGPATGYETQLDYSPPVPYLDVGATARWMTLSRRSARGRVCRRSSPFWPVAQRGCRARGRQRRNQDTTRGTRPVSVTARASVHAHRYAE